MSGIFHVVDGVIIDINDRPFTPWGGGTVSRPTGIDPSDGFWGTANYSYGNGNAWRAVADGWNATEVMVPLPGAFGGTDPFNIAQTLAGLGQMLDEWTAAGIVCIVYPWYPQGYDPTSYAGLDSNIRAVQDYLCDNYADNVYVWLETVGEAFTFIFDAASTNWTNWSTVNTGAFNDAITQGWPNMQVMLLGQFGQGIGRMSLTTMYDTWYAARGSDRITFGWHNFGSMPTVAEIATAIDTIQARDMPIICTSFGQNWNDGDPAFGGDNPGSDAIGVEYAKAYGRTSRTGGIAWLATGRHSTVNAYSWRYAYANSPAGKFRPWYDTAEGLNEVGQLIAARGALGPTINGGGIQTVDPIPPVVIPPSPSGTAAAQAQQTRGRLYVPAAGGTVQGGRPRP